MTLEAANTPPFGQQLKRWRAQRGMSQLSLAVEARTSPRHLSFLETGRSRPSHEMIVRLSEALEVPLRDRNDLLLAAGLAPAYPEKALSDETMSPFASICRQMLTRHEPYPAMVVDRWWCVTSANTAAERLLPMPTEGQSLVELFFGDRYQQLLENWADVVWAGYRTLRREALQCPQDEELTRLLRFAEERLPARTRTTTSDGGEALVVAPRMRVGETIIETVSTMVRFSTAREVTLDELRIEMVFPANAAAERFFQEMAPT